MTQAAIVFDIGRVLVNFSLVPIRDFLCERGAIITDLKEFSARIQMREYESGLLSTEDFLIGLDSTLKNRSNKLELSRAWQNIFQPIPEMLALLDLVSSRHLTFLLSNTNELHWAHLDREYKLSSRVSGGVVTSFEARCLKPDAGIYEFTEKKYSLSPNELIFIDDIEAHVLAAQTRGWRGIHHKSHFETADSLTKLGII